MESAPAAEAGGGADAAAGTATQAPPERDAAALHGERALGGTAVRARLGEAAYASGPAGAPAAGQPALTPSLDIAAPVGIRDGEVVVGDPADLQQVMRFLNDYDGWWDNEGSFSDEDIARVADPGFPRGEGDADLVHRLDGAIRSFQEVAVGLDRPDGLIEPGKRTQLTANRLWGEAAAAALLEAAPAWGALGGWEDLAGGSPVPAGSAAQRDDVDVDRFAHGRMLREPMNVYLTGPGGEAIHIDPIAARSIYLMLSGQPGTGEAMIGSIDEVTAASTGWREQGARELQRRYGLTEKQFLAVVSDAYRARGRIPDGAAAPGEIVSVRFDRYDLERAEASGTNGIGAAARFQLAPAGVTLNRLAEQAFGAGPPEVNPWRRSTLAAADALGRHHEGIHDHDVDALAKRVSEQVGERFEAVLKTPGDFPANVHAFVELSRMRAFLKAPASALTADQRAHQDALAERIDPRKLDAKLAELQGGDDVQGFLLGIQEEVRAEAGAEGGAVAARTDEHARYLDSKAFQERLEILPTFEDRVALVRTEAQKLAAFKPEAARALETQLMGQVMAADPAGALARLSPEQRLEGARALVGELAARQGVEIGNRQLDEAARALAEAFAAPGASGLGDAQKGLETIAGVLGASTSPELVAGGLGPRGLATALLAFSVGGQALTKGLPLDFSDADAAKATLSFYANGLKVAGEFGGMLGTARDLAGSSSKAGARAVSILKSVGFVAGALGVAADAAGAYADWGRGDVAGMAFKGAGALIGIAGLAVGSGPAAPVVVAAGTLAWLGDGIWGEPDDAEFQRFKEHGILQDHWTSMGSSIEDEMRKVRDR